MVSDYTTSLAIDTRPLKQRQYEEAIVAETMQEFSQLQNMRATFASQWEESAELVDPDSRNTFFFENYNWPGMKKTQNMVDSTAMLALTRFAAILDSLLTPRNQTWHQLGADNDYVMKDRASRLWFEKATRILFKCRYSPIANFTSQNQQVFHSLGAYGNGGLFIDEYQGEDNIRGFRYSARPLGEMFIHTNHQGQVDGFVRWFRLTARQAVKQFGIEKIPEGMISAFQQQSQQVYSFLHRVCPRSDYQAGMLNEKGKLFASYYISIEGRALMDEGGYNSMPLAFTRYNQAPGEDYGRGPTQQVLPTIKTLNSEKRDFLTQGHRAAVPVLLTADDGIVDFSMRPGALNKGGWSIDGHPLIGTLPTGNIQVSKEMMDEERQIINDAFLVSLFQILTESPQMTATEVMERINEKGILLAPTIGRQQSEYLGPMIHRELDLLSSMRLLPPMPPRLREAGGEYEVVYTSPLSLMQRAQEATGFMRTVENVKELVAVTQDMSLLDRFDFDTAVPEIARIQGVTESWLSDDASVAKKRQARAQAQQQQQQIQAAPAAAAMIKARAAAGKAGTPQSGGAALGNAVAPAFSPGPQPGA